MTIHETLGPRRELRTFHAYDALVRDELDAAAFLPKRAADGALEPLNEPTAERIAERGVRDDGHAFEEARRTYALGAIDDLRRQRERARRDVLAQRADGAECEEDAHAQGFKRGDVGARGDSGRAEGVSLSMSGEEGDVGA